MTPIAEQSYLRLKANPFAREQTSVLVSLMNQGATILPKKGSNTTGKLYTEAAKLFACRKPIVAAVHGPAIGGGFGLALVADFRVGSEQTRFSANFVKLGLHQGFGITHTLPRLVGAQNAHRLLLTGKQNIRASRTGSGFD